MGREAFFKDYESILSDHRFLLFYQGSYQDSPVVNLVEIAEANLHQLYPRPVVKKLIYLLIEMVQNIERYSSHKVSKHDFSLVYSIDNSFIIVTQNVISKSSLRDLHKRLLALKNKQDEELDAQYKELLNSDEQTEKGAGLGLIDIARKTKNNLYHKFLPLDDEHILFQFRIAFPTSDEEMAELPIDNIVPKMITRLFHRNESTLFYSGDFSNQFLIGAIDMVNNIKVKNAPPIGSGFRRTLIEMVQNIKIHGAEVDGKKSGFVGMEWHDEGLDVSGGNLIPKEKEDELTNYLKQLNAASSEKLSELSDERLTDFSDEGGLGLIRIANFIRPATLDFGFRPYGDNHQLYSLKAFFKKQERD